MFFCLSHRTISGCNNNNSPIHLSSTGNHILDIISVSRTVYMSIVPIICLIFNVASIDSYTSGFFFRCIINILITHYFIAMLACALHSNSRCKSCLTMVNMTNSTNINMWLGSLKLLFSHHFLLVYTHN